MKLRALITVCNSCLITACDLTAFKSFLLATVFYFTWLFHLIIICIPQPLINDYFWITRTQTSLEWFIILPCSSFFQMPSHGPACCLLHAGVLKGASLKPEKWCVNLLDLFPLSLDYSYCLERTHVTKHGSGCTLETTSLAGSYVIHAGISLGTSGTQGNPKSLPAENWALFVRSYLLSCSHMNIVRLSASFGVFVSKPDFLALRFMWAFGFWGNAEPQRISENFFFL